jgi:hypothetical protein
MNYFLYRSRFQPRFCQPHIAAVEKFYDIKHKHSDVIEQAELALGIVAEALLKHQQNDLLIYGEIDRKTMQEKINTRLDQAVKKYIGRFQDQLNPSSLGMVKKSIWDSHSSIHDCSNHKYLPCITMPNLALTAIFYYEEQNHPKIFNWLPEGKKERDEMGWYIPIYDKDDINDIGLLGSLMTERYERDTVRKKIVFARYCYPSEYNCKNYGKNYGYYMQIVKDFLGNNFNFSNFDLKEIEGMIIPSMNEIPFVYLSIEAEDILKLFINYLNNWILPHPNDKVKPEVQKLVVNMQEISDCITSTATAFSDDLNMFFSFFRTELVTLISLLKSNPNPSSHATDIEEIIKLIVKDTPKIQNQIWIETSIDSALRFSEIKQMFSTKTQGAVK